METRKKANRSFWNPPVVPPVGQVRLVGERIIEAHISPRFMSSSAVVAAASRVDAHAAAGRAIPLRR
jgi:hypothetical protein